MYPDASFGHNVYVAKIACEELSVCVVCEMSALLYPEACFIHINIHSIYFTCHTVHIIILFIQPCPLCTKGSTTRCMFALKLLY